MLPELPPPTPFLPLNIPPPSHLVLPGPLCKCEPTRPSLFVDPRGIYLAPLLSLRLTGSSRRPPRTTPNQQPLNLSPPERYSPRKKGSTQPGNKEADAQPSRLETRFPGWRNIFEHSETFHGKEFPFSFFGLPIYIDIYCAVLGVLCEIVCFLPFLFRKIWELGKSREKMQM